MNLLTGLKRTTISGTALLSIIGLTSGGIVNAASTSNASTSTALTANQQQRLADIKSKGAAEITRRLKALSSVSSKIGSTTKLSASDQTYLESEVNTEVSGLTNLQTQLAADTTLTQAEADAQSIYTEYRVYALVLPKVWLVTTADNQQTTETKLSTLATNLQSRITADQDAGKDVTSLQNELNDMNTKISSAQAISTSMEQSVLTLQPSDYNSDHTILSGDSAQLKTAHSDNEASYTDANNITNSLKTL